MKVRKQDFALGLAAIVFLALFLVTILWLYPAAKYSAKRIAVYFRHEDGIAPIKPGSPVLLGGSLQVGQVVNIYTKDLQIETLPGKPREFFIVVEADINTDVILYLDCQITTDQPAVGGGGFLVILNIGTPTMPAVTKGTMLRGLPPQSLAATISALSRRLLAPDGMIDRLDRTLNPDVAGSPMNKLSVSLSDVNEMTRVLREQLDAERQMTLMNKFHGLTDDLKAVTAALRQQTAANDPANLVAKIHVVLDRLAEALVEATALVHENRDEVQRTLANLERITDTVNNDLLVALRAEFRRDDPRALLGKLHAGLDRLNGALDDVRVITDTGRKLIVLNRASIEQTIANLHDTSRQLDATSRKVFLAPWLLFYKPTTAETQEVQVLEAARTFAEAATYLNDAAARLEAVVAAAPPGTEPVAADEEIKTVRNALRTAFDRFKQAEQFFYEKMK